MDWVGLQLCLLFYCFCASVTRTVLRHHATRTCRCGAVLPTKTKVSNPNLPKNMAEHCPVFRQSNTKFRSVAILRSHRKQKKPFLPSLYKVVEKSSSYIAFYLFLLPYLHSVQVKVTTNLYNRAGKSAIHHPYLNISIARLIQKAGAYCNVSFLLPSL